MKGDFSRLQGDLSRHTFDKLKHYAGVLHQQGRVWLDSDWNTEVLLQLSLLRQETFDIVGKCGAPKPGTAFKISPPGAGRPLDDFEISGGPGPEGRYYVDGILCHLDSSASYLTQPDFPNPPRITMPTTASGLTALVYVEVWQRLITHLEDEEIREVALGGPDTATRVKTIAQVKVVPLSTRGKISCEGALASLPVGGGTLTTLQPTDTLPTDPCRLPDPASYTGRENHLYRVEIHDGGDVPGATGGSAFSVKLQVDANVGTVTLSLSTALTSGQTDALRRSGAVTITEDDGQLERVVLNDISSDGRTVTLARGLHNAFTTAKNATVTGGVARFKWSRDNASFAVRVTAVSADRKTLTLASLGRDQVTALREGDLIEISDDASELGPARGHLTNLTADPNPDTFEVTIADSLPLSFGVGGTSVTSPPSSPPLSPPDSTPVGGHLILRRWDGQGSAQAVFNETTTPQLNLGDGVHIQFGGTNLQSGDYWQFAARSVDGSIEALDNAPPMGIARHRCALAIVRWADDVEFDLSKVIGFIEQSQINLLGTTALRNEVVRRLRLLHQPTISEASLRTLAQEAGAMAAQIDILLRALLDFFGSGRPGRPTMTVVEDCREPFLPLTDQPKAEPGIHVTRVLALNANNAPSPLLNDSDVLPETIIRGINVECDADVDPATISRPTFFVTVEPPFQLSAVTNMYQSLILGANVSAAGNTISWRPEGRFAGLLKQLVGAMPEGDRGILVRLTLKGNFIWARDNAALFLDGEGFGVRQLSAINTDVRLPSGDTRRGGDFEMWFWLVRALTLKSFSLSPSDLISGSLSQGTITLSRAAPAGGSVVSLSSSNLKFATVPATVTVPAGSATATFPVQTISGRAGQVNITATFSGVSLIASLKLVRLDSLALNPTQVNGGESSKATVKLSGPAPLDAVVSISSSNPVAASVPPTVTVPAGKSSATFTVRTIIEGGSFDITASLGGVSKKATLGVFVIG